MMPWRLSHRADRIAAALADRHYTRQKPGTRQFVPPGRCVVLLAVGHDALWVSSWPYPQYVKHAWAGAWICSLFRNESSAHRSSELIIEAVAVTRWLWGEPPDLGMVTFVDAAKVRSTNPGYCFQMAGWHKVGTTKGGLIALQLLPALMPAPQPAHQVQPTLFPKEVYV